jgi:hypothetical protein
LRHLAERFTQIIHVETGNYYPNASGSERFADAYNLVIKKLGFIDAHNIYLIGQ